MRSFLISRAVILALILVAIPLGLVAAPGPETLVEIENGGTILVFHPIVEYRELVLTVTGPCDFQYRQVARDGETPFFKLDARTIDGPYTFNIMRNEKIDPEIVQILKRARVEDDAETPRALCRDGRLPGPPVSQSGGFMVQQQEIQYDTRIEDQGAAPGEGAGLGSAAGGGELQAQDFVINDDLIVDGSACIGFDCVNGESFGFDTIRLKENNLRIKFDDTSVAASFPRNDWQLTANDSANGGASKFSIDDISGGRTPFTVEANARSHSLYVDDGGRIGSRTSTPSVEIHTIDGDTPTLRLQQDGSSGFAPQTWDVAGNETNFFVRDVTNGSTLPFRIRPGAPTSAIFVDVDGNVGIGTSSPDFDVHVENTSASANFAVQGTSGSVVLQDIDAPTDEQAAQNLVTNGAWRLRGLNDSLTSQTVTGIELDLGDGDVGINCTGSSFDLTVGDGGTCASGAYSGVSAGDSTFTVSSSRSLKEHLTEVGVEGILERVGEVGVYTYDFIDGPKDRLGLMAEDFHRVFGRGSEKMINGQEVQMALWLAVQELTRQNAELAKRVAELEGQGTD